MLINVNWLHPVVKKPKKFSEGSGSEQKSHNCSYWCYHRFIRLSSPGSLMLPIILCVFSQISFPFLATTIVNLHSSPQVLYLTFIPSLSRAHGSCKRRSEYRQHFKVARLWNGKESEDCNLKRTWILQDFLFIPLIFCLPTSAAHRNPRTISRFMLALYLLSHWN